MKRLFKDHLHLTSGERRGTLILIVFCVIFWGLPRYYQLFLRPEPPGFSDFERLLNQWEETEKGSFQRPGVLGAPSEERETGPPRERPGNPNRRSEQDRASTPADRDTSVAAALFPFDPNQVDEAAFFQLGLSPLVIRNVVKYRENGGVFRKKEDLRKIYGLTEAQYLRLAPFISIAPPPGKEAGAGKLHRIDINRASPEEWARLYGIGPVLSQRIVRFREKLGGFSGIDQVAETYGLPDTTFNHIRPYLDPSPVLRKLPLNRGTAEELAAHPYLNLRQARAMVAFRQNHGPFNEVVDLARTGVLDEATIEKIMPYLDFSILD